MKRTMSVFLSLLLCFALAVRVEAAQMPRLVDGADLLTQSQEAELLDRLDRVSGELQADVVIVTMESLGGYSADAVIGAYYDEYGFGYGPDRDGVVLLLSMAERDYRILSNGFAAQAITLSDIDVIGDHIVGELSGGEYMEAFMEFVSLCVYEIDGERNGFPFDFGKSLLVSLAIGFAVAFIATLMMRLQLKSVRTRTEAREYKVPGSMKMIRSSDLYLYRTLDRRARPKQTSSYSHSGGSRSSGGGGGRNIGGGKF